MESFDPLREVIDAQAALHGVWPNFHDAAVLSLTFEHGDVRPAENVFVGPAITARIETRAMQRNLRLTLVFRDCGAIAMTGFDVDNEVLDIGFVREARGFFTDGVTPLPPLVRVAFVPAGAFRLDFTCFAIEARDTQSV